MHKSFWCTTIKLERFNQSTGGSHDPINRQEDHMILHSKNYNMSYNSLSHTLSYNALHQYFLRFYIQSLLLAVVGHCFLMGFTFPSYISLNLSTVPPNTHS